MLDVEIKIEKCVPVGGITAPARLLKTMLELDVGDSFLCPKGQTAAAEKARALANKRDRKITSRMTDDGLRFWRVR